MKTDKTQQLAKKQKRLDKAWIASRHPPLSLDEAIARLQDDKVYEKAMKGVRYKESKK